MSGPLKKYRVNMHGRETVMKLNEADAQRYGGIAIDGDACPIPPEDPAAGDGEGGGTEPAEPPAEAPKAAPKAKAKKPANKARGASSKGTGA